MVLAAWATAAIYVNEVVADESRQRSAVSQSDASVDDDVRARDNARSKNGEAHAYRTWPHDTRVSFWSIDCCL